MDYFPYLDIAEAVRDADRNLEDIQRTVETLLMETDGQQPPEAMLLLRRLATLRRDLSQVLPLSVQAEVQKEQDLYNQEDAYWSS